MAAVFVLLQWGNTADISFFGKNLNNVNVLLVMVGSAAGGVVLAGTVKLLFHAIGKVRAAHRAGSGSAKAAPAEEIVEATAIDEGDASGPQDPFGPE